MVFDLQLGFLYEISLSKDQFIRLSIDKGDLALALVLYDPAGKKLLEQVSHGYELLIPLFRLISARGDSSSLLLPNSGRYCLGGRAKRRRPACFAREGCREAAIGP